MVMAAVNTVACWQCLIAEMANKSRQNRENSLSETRNNNKASLNILRTNKSSIGFHSQIIQISVGGESSHRIKYQYGNEILLKSISWQ